MTTTASELDPNTTANIATLIAAELTIDIKQARSAIELLDGGATVPFIARYRKEVTNGLTDIQLRQLEERLIYLRELEDRRDAILKSIKEQEKLTPELEQSIREADSKHRLEDLYLPYKKKRRTKGQLAKEAGLEPLAESLLNDPTLDPTATATPYINKEAGYEDEKAVLAGAKYILMERFSEEADLLATLRNYLNENAHIISTVAKEKEESGKKYRDYFEHNERIAKTPSHRALAILRGRKESVLQVKVDIDPKTSNSTDDKQASHPCEQMIAKHIHFIANDRAADHWLSEVIRWTWRVKIHSQMENELLSDLKSRSEDEAIKVFSQNLHDLLMAAPAGPKNTLGLDPGIRTGVKVTALDGTGKLLSHTTIFPHEPKKEWDKSINVLAKLCKEHAIELISIGNGTASRETDRLVSDMLKQHTDLHATKLIVSESGASVYSASEYASKEFPKLDVSFRGAVSIARRLQDPLAELVKIDPKAIGVGQYQHDANQSKLARALDGVVEDCVNAVGVDVNTASAPLLARIAGLNQTIATNIVSYRDQYGPFKSRATLKEVPRLGNKTYEQAAGFLRVNNGENPLDASAVHPEAYPLVQSIAQKHERTVTSLINDSAFLQSIDAHAFADEQFGVPTVMDILQELEKPGRDPRPEFKTAQFKEGIESINDLKENMILEGVISNVTNFGAFVDLGVHQDGLIHISMLSDKFISNPREVVKAGDIVKVKVIEIDIERNRIGLTRMINERAVTGAPSKRATDKERRTDKPANRAKAASQKSRATGDPRRSSTSKRSDSKAPSKQGGTFADLFANAKQIRSKR